MRRFVRIATLTAAAALASAVGCSSESNAPATSTSAGGASGTGATAGSLVGNAGGGAAPVAGGQGGATAGTAPLAGTAQLGGAAGEAAGGAGPRQECTSQTPGACQRGLYVSLYADHSGKVVFGGETAQHLHILDDAGKRELVLGFIEARGIASLSLYDLTTILADETLTSALRDFVSAARARGVAEVNAIGSAAKPSWDAIAAAQQQAPLFDGLVTEIEFWNGGATFEEFQSMASYVRGLELKTPQGAALPLAAYIGRPTSEQFTALLPLVDRLFVHVYVKDAEQAYGYGQERFAAIAAGNAALERPVEVRPIFSAEGEAWAAGDEHFMGDWLTDHTLGDAEAAFLSGWESEVAPLPPLTGFQYYDYLFLERYLE